MSEEKPKLPDHEYLYGLTKSEMVTLKTMQYEEALNYKITSAKDLLTKLYIPHFTKRDVSRISKVQKAVKFNTVLLSELKG